MLIDWFTTIAQIVNFLILASLLKHFLYGPIIRAMDKREGRIAEKLQEAKQSRREAVEAKKKYREKTESLDREKESILHTVKDKAEQTRQDIMEQIRQETEEIRNRWRNDLREQQDSFLTELQSKSAEQIVILARKALQDLADQDLEEKMADVFIGHLQEMDQTMISQVRQSLTGSTSTVVICSVFDVTPTVKKKLTKAIHTLLKNDSAVEYEHQPKLIAGFRLKAGSMVIGWNLEEYLNDFQEEMQKCIRRETGGRQGGSDHES